MTAQVRSKIAVWRAESIELKIITNVDLGLDAQSSLLTLKLLGLGYMNSRSHEVIIQQNSLMIRIATKNNSQKIHSSKNETLSTANLHHKKWAQKKSETTEREKLGIENAKLYFSQN